MNTANHVFPNIRLVIMRIIPHMIPTCRPDTARRCEVPVISNVSRMRVGIVPRSPARSAETSELVSRESNFSLHLLQITLLTLFCRQSDWIALNEQVSRKLPRSDPRTSTESPLLTVRASSLSEDHTFLPYSIERSAPRVVDVSTLQLQTPPRAVSLLSSFCSLKWLLFQYNPTSNEEAHNNSIPYLL